MVSRNTGQNTDRNTGIDISRRTVVAGLGGAVGLALTRGQWPGSQNYAQLSQRDALNALDLSLSAGQRAVTVLPWDHPSRQLTNTSSVYKGPHIGTLFDGHQIALIERLYETMLSNTGQNWFRNTVGLEGRLSGASVRIYSDQQNQPSALGSQQRNQVVISGGHFMLRGGSPSDSAYAFGGPIAYGQELGNNRFKVQGNAFKTHGDAVNELHSAMTDQERHAAYLSSPPMELVNQTLGQQPSFPGVKIGNLSKHAQDQALHALTTIFAAYPQHEQSEAFSAIESHGGVAQMHLALYNDYGFYADGQRVSDLTQQEQASRELHYAQVWRIEGPNCVIHFKGYPHVHAYINVVKDFKKMAVGEELAALNQPMHQAQVKLLMQEALRVHSGEALAYYPLELAGRLSPGIVSTGSLYALDPFANRIATVDVHVDAMSQDLKQTLLAQGAELKAGQTHRLATLDYMLRAPHIFGEPAKHIESGAVLRDALIAQLRSHALVI